MGVGVLEGVGVFDGVGVVLGVMVLVGVGEGPAAVAGRPITRAVRNCSTIPSRLALRCKFGQILLIIGVINGWSKSIETMTRSPGPPGSSPGTQVAAVGISGSGGSSATPALLEQTSTLKYPGSPTVVTPEFFRIATAPIFATSLIEGIRAPSS